MSDEQMNYEKAKVFLENNIEVHIVKHDGTFYNGLITNISESKDFFFINDLKEGKKLIFFSQLNKEIEEYKRIG